MNTNLIKWDKVFRHSKVFKQVAFIAGFHMFLISGDGYLARILYARPQQTNGFWQTVAINLNQWDARWYLQIVKYGYTGKSAAFFPAYPMLIRSFTWFGIDPVWAGLLISNLAFFAACILLFKLVRLDYDNDIALRTIWYMALFPTAFYFSGIYTESLYLAVVLASFYAARRGKWVEAGFFGMLAAMTRNLGIFLVIPLFWEYMAGREYKWHSIRRDVCALLLVPLGTVIFSLYLWRVLGDPLAFAKAQRFWGRELNPPWVAIYQAFVYINRDFYLGRNLLDLSFTFLGIGTLIYSGLRLRRSYFWYGFFGVFIPACSPAPNAALMSMPRFVLVLFPVYLMMALEVKKPGYQNALISAMSGLLVYLNVMFSFGRWVA